MTCTAPSSRRPVGPARDRLLPTVWRRRVLAVDDDPIFLSVLELHLRPVVEDLRVAFEGSSALATARDWRPDLILLDLNLPGRDGFDLCRRLREDARTRSTPILVLSARDNPECVAKALDWGADDFLAKPIRPIELQARIRLALRGARRLPDRGLALRVRLDAPEGPVSRGAAYERMREVVRDLSGRDVHAWEGGQVLVPLGALPTGQPSALGRRLLATLRAELVRFGKIVPCVRLHLLGP